MAGWVKGSLGRLAVAVCLAAMAPGGALLAYGSVQSEKDAKPEKPVTDSNPDARQVAETPLSDLNVKKGDIPPVLTQALDDPYSLAGMKSCPALTREVDLLNSALGDDVDIASARKNGLKAGSVAQSVVGGFIPFRSVIREVSGANAEQRKMEMLIRAGMARRGFLKGIGMTRGCKYPARPG